MIAINSYLTTGRKARTKPSENNNIHEEIVRKITDGDQSVSADQ